MEGLNSADPRGLAKSRLNRRPDGSMPVTISVTKHGSTLDHPVDSPNAVPPMQASQTVLAVCKPAMPVTPAAGSTSFTEVAARRSTRLPSRINTRMALRMTNPTPILPLPYARVHAHSDVSLREGIREILPSDFARDEMIQVPPRDELRHARRKEANIASMQMEGDTIPSRYCFHWATRHDQKRMYPSPPSIGCECWGGGKARPGGLGECAGPYLPPGLLVSPTASDASRGVSCDPEGV